jgi:uncharacterized glyoxalase superfamily protein PhnB
MASINPFIHFNGNTEEAFTFYKTIFGGEFTNITRFKDLPNAEIFFQKKRQITSCILLCRLELTVF